MCYIDLNNSEVIVDKEKLVEWFLVDVYIGGVEYVVFYFFYVCFWYKFLYDIGVVLIKEFF